MNIIRLLGYIERIGNKGIPPTRISRNTRYVEKIINILKKYDLIEIRGERYRYIYLNERGLKLYNLLRQVELILSKDGEIKLEKISDKKFISKKYAPEILIQSPSFLREKTWLAILSKRGRDEA